VDEFGSRISFLTVYILEAHAADTWPIGSDIIYNQTSSLEERVIPCKAFAKDNNYHYPMMIDSPPDPFNKLFAAWPLRFYVIDTDGTILFIEEPNGAFIMVEGLMEWLEDYFEAIQHA